MEIQSSQVFKATICGIQIGINGCSIHIVGFGADMQSGNYPPEIVPFAGFISPHNGALAKPEKDALDLYCIISRWMSCY